MRPNPCKKKVLSHLPATGISIRNTDHPEVRSNLDEDGDCIHIVEEPSNESKQRTRGKAKGAAKENHVAGEASDCTGVRKDGNRGEPHRKPLIVCIDVGSGNGASRDKKPVDSPTSPKSSPDPVKNQSRLVTSIERPPARP